MLRVSTIISTSQRYGVFLPDKLRLVPLPPRCMDLQTSNHLGLTNYSVINHDLRLWATVLAFSSILSNNFAGIREL